MKDLLHITDTAPATGSYASAIVIRTFADVWPSMGDPKEERARHWKALDPYQVNGHLMALARDDAVFMQCLPAHRGEEVTPDVVDGGRFQAFCQTANWLPAPQAVLYALLTDRLKGHR
ncbi:hypothetical protein E1200_01280 [Actinomadura sp. GC306]|uniref:hypothetical protein n=1 Tax=Actinomadura sp. GC306 TaxID=2530367 RepID=UPI00104B2B39|nr:hypothetical protein [Actinomadura sp. GC306]TDC71700.1 hypothetical protein E1200_01280 [Actinomadura sp. GC306]